MPGAVVALVGAILIGLSSLTGLSGDVAGDLLALAGAACMAGHWLCSRYARRTVEALPYTYLVYNSDGTMDVRTSSGGSAYRHYMLTVSDGTSHQVYCVESGIMPEIRIWC